MNSRGSKSIKVLMSTQDLRELFFNWSDNEKTFRSCSKIDTIIVIYRFKHLGNQKLNLQNWWSNHIKIKWVNLTYKFTSLDKDQNLTFFTLFLTSRPGFLNASKICHFCKIVASRVFSKIMMFFVVFFLFQDPISEFVINYKLYIIYNL